MVALRETHIRLNWVNMTPGEGNYTFGYYDRCPWNDDVSLHLALKIPQQTRLPEPGETAEVGLIERETRDFVPVAKTYAWCHQQGAMTLWLKQRPGCFVFNDFEKDGNSWRPVARVYNVAGEHVDDYDGFHIYTVSNDGKWGASLDMGRIPRRGYSYACAPLPEARIPADTRAGGLYIVDMVGGERRLIASYQDMMNIHPVPAELEDARVWLNHTIYNCDGSRVMVLFRSWRERQPWFTNMFTMNIDGTDLKCSLPHRYWTNWQISHQMWGRTPREILIDAKEDDTQHRYVVFDESTGSIALRKVSDGMGQMGHTVFSPDGRWLVGDTYARDGRQLLCLVEVGSGRTEIVGEFRHETEGAMGDMRCDLHPRWSRDGRFITIDTIHEGPRNVYLLDAEEAREKLFS